MILQIAVVGARIDSWLFLTIESELGARACYRLTKTLEEWVEAPPAEHQAEPNSGLEHAVQCMLRRWEPPALFRRARALPRVQSLAADAILTPQKPEVQNGPSG